MRVSPIYEAFTSGYSLIEPKLREEIIRSARADLSKNLLHNMRTAQENETFNNDQETGGKLTRLIAVRDVEALLPLVLT